MHAQISPLILGVTNFKHMTQQCFFLLKHTPCVCKHIYTTENKTKLYGIIFSVSTYPQLYFVAALLFLDFVENDLFIQKGFNAAVSSTKLDAIITAEKLK